MSEPALGDLPETLLAVIVEAARTVLRGRDPAALTSALRPLARVDQRAAASSTVRRQFVAALSRDGGLRAEVAAALLSRPDVAAVLEGFDPAAVVSTASSAADSDTLDTFVAAVWAGSPQGWERALGAAAAVDLERRARGALLAERDALFAQVGVLERDTAARAAATSAEAAHAAELTAKLASERAARRAADERATEATGAMDQLRTDLDAARAALEQRAVELANAREELGRERDRRREAERTKAVPAPIAPPVATVGADELASLADAAGELTRQLRDAATRVETAAQPAPSARVPTDRPRPPAPATRTKPKLPGGLVADTVDGVRAMLSQGGAMLVVDGYNVSNHAWPGATALMQRDRLERGLQQVAQRFGCEIVCCYDGDDTVGARPRRIPGVRVQFSARHEEADELVVDTVRELPKRVPAVVASSDGWVRQHAEAEGAVVVSAATTVAFITAAGRR
jgi:predicted RNA-binding protein with PIN domain